MKRKLRGLVPLLVIAIGLLVLFYPTISNFLVMRNASRAVTNYDAATQSISDKQYQQMLAAAHAYNEQIAANNPVPRMRLPQPSTPKQSARNTITSSI